jgi:hypothetical protein
VRRRKEKARKKEEKKIKEKKSVIKNYPLIIRLIDIVTLQLCPDRRRSQ